jgi:hypothetical protein
MEIGDIILKRGDAGNNGAIALGDVSDSGFATLGSPRLPKDEQER